MEFCTELTRVRQRSPLSPRGLGAVQIHDQRKSYDDVENNLWDTWGVCGFCFVLGVGPQGGCQRTSPCKSPTRIFQIRKFFGNNLQVVVTPCTADGHLLHRRSSRSALSSQRLLTWLGALCFLLVRGGRGDRFTEK